MSTKTMGKRSCARVETGFRSCEGGGDEWRWDGTLQQAVGRRLTLNSQFFHSSVRSCFHLFAAIFPELVPRRITQRFCTCKEFEVSCDQLLRLCKS